MLLLLGPSLTKHVSFPFKFSQILFLFIRVLSPGDSNPWASSWTKVAMAPLKKPRESEFERFLTVSARARHAVEPLSALAWWKVHEAEFPVLAMLAKRFLCIAITSTASEQGFSTMKRVVGEHSSSLTPQHVCQAVFLRHVRPVLEAYFDIDIVDLYCKKYKF